MNNDLTTTITGSRILTPTEYGWIAEAIQWAENGFSPFSDFIHRHILWLNVTELSNHKVVLKGAKFTAIIEVELITTTTTGNFKTTCNVTTTE